MSKRSIVILFLVLAVCIAAVKICGESGVDLSDSRYDNVDSKWDLYYECTARQKEGGYGVVEAGRRCETLRPD